MVGNVWVFLGAVVFLCIGVLDAAGVQALVQKRYRGLAATRAWQKRHAALELLFSLSGIVFCYLREEQRAAVAAVGGAVLLSFVLIGVNNRAFRKALRETERP